MSTASNLAIRLFRKNTKEELSSSLKLPVYFSLEVDRNLVMINTTPANGLYNYTIQYLQGKIVISPQDAHFDLYLHKPNGRIFQILRPFAINDGDHLGIDEVYGPEWTIQITGDNLPFPKDDQESNHCQFDHTPVSKDTAPPSLTQSKEVDLAKIGNDNRVLIVLVALFFAISVFAVLF
jgi:hypothetical protein